MPRKRGARPIHAMAVLDLWGACNRRDRLYVMCVLALERDALQRVREIPAGFADAITYVLSRLGLTGAIASTMLKGLQAIRPEDLVG